jgi:hypothetical protein
MSSRLMCNRFMVDNEKYHAFVFDVEWIPMDTSLSLLATWRKGIFPWLF